MVHQDSSPVEELPHHYTSTVFVFTMDNGIPVSGGAVHGQVSHTVCCRMEDRRRHCTLLLYCILRVLLGQDTRPLLNIMTTTQRREQLASLLNNIGVQPSQRLMAC